MRRTSRGARLDNTQQPAVSSHLPPAKTVPRLGTWQLHRQPLSHRLHRWGVTRPLARPPRERYAGKQRLGVAGGAKLSSKTMESCATRTNTYDAAQAEASRTSFSTSHSRLGLRVQCGCFCLVFGFPFLAEITGEKAEVRSRVAQRVKRPTALGHQQRAERDTSCWVMHNYQITRCAERSVQLRFEPAKSRA